jgi:carbamoyl-phosphate synthase large subunit
LDLVLYGADVSQSAPALLFCDHQVIVPRINDENYIPALMAFCEKEKIDALIPTIDTDLLILSQNREQFAALGTWVVISAPDRIALCRDKRLTADYFHSVGLYSPVPTDDVSAYDSGFPAFIKPKDGSSSVFAYKVNDRQELLSYAAQVPDYIIQPFIRGTEYTVDIFCDFDGNPIYITPRIRLAVRAGEVLKTRIVQDEQIIAEMKQLLADYKPCGAITVQLIRQESTGMDYYIEINPRFGGGAPITMMAGADSAQALLQLVAGQQLTYIPLAAEDGAVYSRFDQSVRVE